MADFPVTKVAEDSKTVTLSWPEQPGDGYRFYRDGVVVSRSFDPTKTTVRIAKADAYVIEVLHLSAGDKGHYPPVAPEPTPEPTPEPVPEPEPEPQPEPVPGGEPATWGYRPAVPAGWAVVQGTTVSIPSTKTKTYYKDCKVSGWLKDTNSDLIFVDCDFRGSTWGTQGARIHHYGCIFGATNSTTSEKDGAQIKPATSGGTRPTDWIFQGCTFKDITRASGTSYHIDGIQFGGVLRPIVRHCYFENVAVEMILFNSWNGTPEDGLVESSYFGNRQDPGGPPIHFSGSTKNCKALNNYYDGTVASIASTTSGCSISGTKPRSDWKHGDPWETY